MQTTMQRQQIYSDIEAERDRQDQKWGGSEHDDQHSEIGWLSFIGEHQEDAGIAIRTGAELVYRAELVKIAALAVAAIEALERKRGEWE